MIIVTLYLPKMPVDEANANMANNAAFDLKLS